MPPASLRAMARKRSKIPLARMSMPGASPLRRAIDAHGFVLLYDGVCGLCNGFVQFILKRDPTGPMRFATLQGSFGDEARRLLPELASVDSMVLLYREGAWVRSTAALEVARYLGGVWLIALAAYLLPRPIRDWVYDRVAAIRYRTFGKYDACPIPPPESRKRFLD